ncbi:hypothetical protein GXM_07461 [Nostoc sphaeroides CCNUC1]|uniref:Uncharacterized protein n=1 Tax=Nostoc sphaeroides CCNUC1 TaxID=2653204 RepID=A0A5P8WB07_9NOSO|nr:hypothetical protein GXM_07461 [Nostoc sphaeroides CCNUC1]
MSIDIKNNQPQRDCRLHPKMTTTEIRTTKVKVRMALIKAQRLVSPR